MKANTLKLAYTGAFCACVERMCSHRPSLRPSHSRRGHVASSPMHAYYYHTTTSTTYMLLPDLTRLSGLTSAAAAAAAVGQPVGPAVSLQSPSRAPADLHASMADTNVWLAAYGQQHNSTYLLPSPSHSPAYGHQHNSTYPPLSARKNCSLAPLPS
jgi:hypothetical protein